MPSGGARVRSGPPPDPTAFRRDRDATAWRRFPATREDEAPAFPLPRRTRRERVLWEKLWADGVANAWAEYHLEHQVALYVRTLAQAEKGIGGATLLRTVLAMEDRLGLTPGGLARNLWIIGADPLGRTAEAPAVPARGRPAGPSARERLEVIRGGA